MRRRQEGRPEHREHPGQRADDSAVTSAIQAKLSQDESIDWIVTLGAPHRVGRDQGDGAARSTVKLVTFDLNADAAKAIQDGKIQFSIDQQPYLQGYMAVTRCSCTTRTGTILGGGWAVVDRSVVRR